MGYKIEIFTDHKNLTYESTECSSQRAQHGRGIIQEFDIELKFIAGEANIVADAISRLPKEKHETPLPKEQIELNLSELLDVSNLYVTETVDQFAINADEIDFPLAPQLVEVEHKLELHTAVGIPIRAALSDSNFPIGIS